VARNARPLWLLPRHILLKHKQETTMHPLAALVRRRALPIYCALTIALSFAAALLPIAGEAVPVVLVFIPALVALALTALTDGWAGVRSLTGRLGRWRVRPLWVVVAVALGLVVRLLISVIALLLGLIPTILLRPWSPVQLALFAAMLLVFAIPEELGWRGYALPKLLKARSPLAAGLLIGALWGSLHVALTLPGMMLEGAPALAVVLEVTGVSVLTTWLYIRSGGSLLLASVLHAAQSFFVIVNEGIPLAQQMWLMAGVYMAMALVVALVAGPHFTRKPTTSVDDAALPAALSEPSSGRALRPGR
jgi:membrane protease YdiL (CAAX protease family)